MYSISASLYSTKKGVVKMQKNVLKVIAIIACIAAAVVFGGRAFAEDPSPRVREAVDLLKAKANALGAPSLQGGELCFGSTKVSGDFSVVDAVNKEKGCTATLFVKEDDNFMRVSTNVMMEGKRAVGTALDVRGKAFAALSTGESFYGVIDVLGKKYDTAYEPIKDASGTVIGAYYVGFAV